MRPGGEKGRGCQKSVSVHCLSGKVYTQKTKLELFLFLPYHATPGSDRASIILSSDNICDAMSPTPLLGCEKTASSDMSDFTWNKAVLAPLLSHWVGWVESSKGERKGGRAVGSIPTASHLWLPVERKLCVQWRNSHGPRLQHGNLRILHGFIHQGRAISWGRWRSWFTETPSLWQSCLPNQRLLLNVLEFPKVTFRALGNQGERKNKKGISFTGYLVCGKLMCIPHLVLLTTLWNREVLFIFYLELTGFKKPAQSYTASVLFSPHFTIQKSQVAKTSYCSESCVTQGRPFCLLM